MASSVTPNSPSITLPPLIVKWATPFPIKRPRAVSTIKTRSRIKPVKNVLATTISFIFLAQLEPAEGGKAHRHQSRQQER